MRWWKIVFSGVIQWGDEIEKIEGEEFFEYSEDKSAFKYFTDWIYKHYKIKPDSLEFQCFTCESDYDAPDE